MKKILPIVLTSFLSALLAVFIYEKVKKPGEVIIKEHIPVRYTSISDNWDGSKQRNFLSSSPTDFTLAAKISTPAVVFVKTLQENGNTEFWHPGGYTASSGSGVIVSPDGFIVTNNHVIEGGGEISVSLHNRHDYRAELVGIDPSTDLALLKIEAAGLDYLEFGNSDSLSVGEWVLAVGNPFNLESTVTAGIVSAKGRNIDILETQDRIESFIQTDAAVNPGNSGGALVNTNAELIGINTAIITRSGRYEGYSFAVPANLVRKVIKDLRDYGAVQRGLLGVFIEELNHEKAQNLGLAAVEGVYITRVSPESGAAEAGLQRGDVIIGINGIKTKTLPEMQEQVGRYRPGNVISVEYLRDGKKKLTEVTLKNKSNTTALLNASDERILKNLGFELRDLTEKESESLKAKGVKVISIFHNSKIERTNMQPDFVITKINDKLVSNIEEFLSLLKETRGNVMLEGVYENFPGEYYYAFPLD